GRQRHQAVILHIVQTLSGLQSLGDSIIAETGLVASCICSFSCRLWTIGRDFTTPTAHLLLLATGLVRCSAADSSMKRRRPSSHAGNSGSPIAFDNRHSKRESTGRGAGRLRDFIETTLSNASSSPANLRAARENCSYVAPLPAFTTWKTPGRFSTANSRKRVARSRAYVGVPVASEIANICWPSRAKSTTRLKKFLPPVPQIKPVRTITVREYSLWDRRSPSNFASP